MKKSTLTKFNLKNLKFTSVLAFLAFSITSTAATTSFLPTHDTYVELVKTSDRNAVDFGSGDTSNHRRLKVKNQSSTKRVTFMKFDISEHKGNISSAKINLITDFGTITEKNPGETEVTIYGVSDTKWTENSLSWNKAISKGLFTEKTPEGTGNNIVVPENAVNLGTIRVSSDKNSYDIDVTKYLAGKKVATFMFIGEYGNGANLSILSKENGKDKDRTTLVISDK